MRHYVVGTFAAVFCALAVAACGSSGGPGAATGGSSASKTPSFLPFAQCMRSHGVPNFPDPSGSGGIQLANGMNPAAPAFKKAQAQCFKYMPGGGPPRSGADVAKNKAQMLAISHCMRAHGVSGFPDPISGPPADPSQFSVAFGRPGAFLAVPKTIDIRSPAFEHAASSCGFGVGGHASPAP